MVKTLLHVSPFRTRYHDVQSEISPDARGDGGSGVGSPTSHQYMRCYTLGYTVSRSSLPVEVEVGVGRDNSTQYCVPLGTVYTAGDGVGSVAPPVVDD